MFGFVCCICIYISYGAVGSGPQAVTIHMLTNVITIHAFTNNAYINNTTMTTNTHDYTHIMYVWLVCTVVIVRFRFVLLFCLFDAIDLFHSS